MGDFSKGGVHKTEEVLMGDFSQERVNEIDDVLMGFGIFFYCF